LTEVASRFEAAKTRCMGRCEMFTDVVPTVERLAAAGVPVLLCSSTRAPLVREFCQRHGLLQRFASVDGWGPGHTKLVQLVAGVAAAGFAPHEVIFVGDTRRDADVARVAGTRFVGLVRAGHPDALAGSGAKVVGSLSELAADLVQAVRSPVTREAHESDPLLAATVAPQPSALEGKALEVGLLVRPHQPAHPGDYPDGSDRAVGHLEVPIDLRTGAERPGDAGAHDGVVGEDDGHPAVE
jgi:hypothetical protein